MATKPVVCPDCGALVPYGRLACAECGALLASVAGAPARRLVRATEADDEIPILDVDAEPDVQGSGPDTHLRPSRIVRRSVGTPAAEEAVRDAAPLELAQGSRGAPDAASGGMDAPNPDPAPTNAAATDVNERDAGLSGPPEAEALEPPAPPTAETGLLVGTDTIAESMATPEDDPVATPGTDAAETAPAAGTPAESGAPATPESETIGQTAATSEPDIPTPPLPGEPAMEQPPIGSAATGDPVRPAESESPSGPEESPAAIGLEPTALLPPAAETPGALLQVPPRPALPPLPGSYLPPSEPPRLADEPWTARHPAAGTGDHGPEPGERRRDVPGGAGRVIGARASVEPPTDAAGWLLALGALVSVVAFVLPWSSSAAGVIGSSQVGTGYLDSWGLANPANMILVLLGAFVLALVLVPNRVPAWIREGAVPIVLGGVDLGVWFTYVSSPFGNVIGVHGLLLAGGLLVAGGLLALRPGRHVGGHPRV